MLFYNSSYFVSILVGACVLTPTMIASAQQDKPALFAVSEPPDAPSPLTHGQSDPGAIIGTVKDNSGAVIAGAGITLEAIASAGVGRMISDGVGDFSFSAVDPGTYRVTVTAKGFSIWISAPITVHGGEKVELPPIVLQVAAASSSVNVAVSPHDIAEEQIKEEEKQRLAGVFPEFYISYKWDAAPLNAKQKFELAWKSSIDPVTLSMTGAIAGYEQARNNIRPFGQGTEGFAKRYGVNYADAFSGIMISGAILPSIFHEDPRYFVKGTGSTQSRILHAMEFPFVCRGDNGLSTPNFSFMLGTYASAELSNTYYPSSSRTNITLDNTLLGFAAQSVSDLLLEFVFPHITTHIPKKMDSAKELILREGSPVHLAATEEMKPGDEEIGKPLAFALIANLVQDGVTVAKAGSKAFGEVIQSDPESGKDGEVSVRLDYLLAGDVKVELRGSKKRGEERVILYGPSGKAISPSRAGKETHIQAGSALTVYVATDTSLHPTQ